MILEIRVVPRAGRNLVKEESGRLKVYLTRAAEAGQANLQLVDLLSEYLKIKKYQIKIIRGEKSRVKLVEINA